MKTTRLSVTQDHINAGEKGNCRRCPVALALQEVFGCLVSVGDNGVWGITGGPPFLRLAYSNKAVTDFMQMFDFGEYRGRPIVPAPFSTEIELTEEGAAQIARWDFEKEIQTWY